MSLFTTQNTGNLKDSMILKCKKSDAAAANVLILEKTNAARYSQNFNENNLIFWHQIGIMKTLSF